MTPWQTIIFTMRQRLTTARLRLELVRRTDLRADQRRHLDALDVEVSAIAALVGSADFGAAGDWKSTGVAVPSGARSSDCDLPSATIHTNAGSITVADLFAAAPTASQTPIEAAIAKPAI